MAAAHAGTPAGGTTTGDVKRPFDFSVSDFATLVKTTAYVDKSLMIRDVFNASSRILITAPPRFGKSTNLDLVKRFFEIEVDARGNPKPVHTTNNYKLFKYYRLEICQDIGFFNEHFGKYPVVYIDFKPLRNVDDSANILDAFKIVIENSFNEHSYILRTEDVFSDVTGFKENDFIKYISDGITKDADRVILAHSFKHLSTILKRFFGKKVFVLIDSYDAFLDSPVIGNKTDREIMVSFVESSIRRLLNDVNCVDRVLITGVIPVIGEGFLCSENNIERYQFLDSHPFTKYYGLKYDEVDAVLSKFIECGEERLNVRNKINDYYYMYNTRNRDIRVRVYNVYSVLQYVCRRTVQSYWCDRRYMNTFKKCFKIQPIRQKLEELLLGNELELDISQPLSITDVLKVKRMITSGKAEHLSIEAELFFVLFYHFGYLSLIDDLDRGVVCVNIPNEEIKYEIAKAVFDENMQLYSSRHVNDIVSDLDALRPDATELHKIFQKFHRSVYHLYCYNHFQFTHVLGCLFMNLVRRAKYSLVMGSKPGPDGPTAVLLKNKQEVAICVTCDDDQSAERSHEIFTDDDGEDRIFYEFSDVPDKVIVAIGSTGRITYSYYFKTGDNLREVTTIRNQW